MGLQRSRARAGAEIRFVGSGHDVGSALQRSRARAGAEIFLTQALAHTAVSYTHLDVYKRQIGECGSALVIGELS